jgi:tetratricopeptide (TPR) repeat protein
MVRFALSSAGWLCTIGLLTTAIPVFAMPENPIAQSTQPASATVEQLLEIGKAQTKKGDFEGAIATYRKVLAIAESARNLPLQMSILHDIGNTYNTAAWDLAKNKHDYPYAIKVFEQEIAPYEKALAIARQIPDRQWEAKLLQAIGESYLSQARVAEKAAREPAKILVLNQKSLLFLQQALEVAKELKDAELRKQISAQIFFSRRIMARTYTDLKQYDLALEQVHLMRILAKASGNPKDEESIRSREYSIHNSMFKFLGDCPINETRSWF